MSGLTSVDGLVSGLNTTEIIDSIMAVEKRPITILQARRERYNNQLLSYQSMQAKLLTVENDADGLSRSSTFDARSSTSSDTNLLTVSAASRAPVGTYDLTVHSVARSHKIASQGFADTDTTTIGTGTFSMTIDGETTELTIDSATTLEGLRDAINLSGAGAKAVIVNDGGSSHPYRLLLTSTQTGLDNQIEITSDLTGGTAPILTENAITQPVAAEDNFYSGSVAAAGSFTGTSGKSYMVEIVNGGAVGAATYRVSEDGGKTWGSEQTLQQTSAIFDDVNGTDLGAKMTFTDGEFHSGDTFTMRTFVPTVQQAQDSVVSMGTGEGSIEITSSSNRITDAIPGVTINVVSADPNKTVNIEVTQNTDAIKSRVENLVKNFNGAIDYITQNSGYNEKTKVAGLFLGDTTMMGLQRRMRTVLFETVPGTEKYDSLFSLGLTVNDNGSLSLDSSKLQTALEENFDDVAKIFRTTGSTTNDNIHFLSAGSKAVETSAGYDIDITQAATRGTAVGASVTDPAVTPITLDSTNNQLIVKINGSSSKIVQLAEKTYSSGSELAAELQSKLQADENLEDKNFSVTFNDDGGTGYFTIRSDDYGSKSTVEIESPANSAAAVLGLDAATITNGTDVQGTINGEPANGSGQLLTGDTDNATTAGVTLRVTLEPGQVADGSDGTMTLVKGIATRLSETLDGYTHSVDGMLAKRQELAKDQVESIDTHIERLNEIMESKRQRLIMKFTAMERALAKMQQQSSYLGLQLASMTGGGGGGGE